MACDFLDRRVCHFGGYLCVLNYQSAKARAQLEQRVGLRLVLNRLRGVVVVCFLQIYCQRGKL
jgi:hypothetical protein